MEHSMNGRNKAALIRDWKGRCRSSWLFG